MVDAEVSRQDQTSGELLRQLLAEPQGLTRVKQAIKEFEAAASPPTQADTDVLPSGILPQPLSATPGIDEWRSSDTTNWVFANFWPIVTVSSIVQAGFALTNAVKDSRARKRQEVHMRGVRRDLSAIRRHVELRHH